MKTKTLIGILIVFFFLILKTPGMCDEFVLILQLDSKKPVFSKGDPEILNKPISMGSTIKPFLAIAALQHGYKAEKKVYCPISSIDTPNAERCWLVKGHGSLTLQKALAHSCSVYFRSLVRSQKKSDILNLFAKYNLIDSSQLKKFQNLTEEDLIGATDRPKIKPGSMLGAYCAIFAKNELLGIQAESGKIKIRTKGPAPKVVKKKLVKEGLRSGALEGTFAKAQASCPAVSVFGKTGTAGIEGQTTKWRGVFIGFAPYPDPKFAVLAIKEPGTGGKDAAFLGIGYFCKIVEESSNLRRIGNKY